MMKKILQLTPRNKPFFNTFKVNKINRSKIFFSIIGGFFLTASFPSMGTCRLAWIALVPMMILIKSPSCKNNFYVGFLTGFVHYITLIYWLTGTLGTYGNVPIFFSIPLLILLSAYLAAYMGIFAAVLGWLRPSPVISIIFFPALWVFLEYVRSFFFTGFPWELIGYSQFNNLNIIQISDIFGVYGVSFLVILSNLSVSLIILYFKGSSWYGQKIALKSAALPALVFVLILSGTWYYGKQRLKTIDKLSNTADSINIALIQGNIDQTIKWDKAYQQSTLEKYIRLSQSVKKDNPDLIIWPETAAPFYIQHNKELSTILMNGICDIGTDFIIGAPSFMLENKGIKYFNSAYLINKKGDIQGRYDKSHLVPFGEYIPFSKCFPFLNKIVEGAGDFHHGRKGVVTHWNKCKLAILICYEIIFPQLAGAMSNNNASLIINITNDAWYGRSSAPFQHFSMAIFRAVENRRSLVRAANTGISGFVGPGGRVLAKTDIFKKAAVTCQVPLMHDKSFYSRYGYVLIVACFGVVLIFSALCMYNKKKGSK